MSDVIYTYYKVTLSANRAIRLGYLSPRYLAKLDYVSDINGRVCIRIERPSLNTVGTHDYKISFAFCSPSDQFNRKIARAIASGRTQISIKSDKPLKVNQVSKMAIELIEKSCTGEKSVLDINGAQVKIPNWLIGSDIVPEYRSKKKVKNDIVSCAEKLWVSLLDDKDDQVIVGVDSESKKIIIYVHNSSTRKFPSTFQGFPIEIVPTTSPVILS